jgi:hypothetical protein
LNLEFDDEKKRRYPAGARSFYHGKFTQPAKRLPPSTSKCKDSSTVATNLRKGVKRKLIGIYSILSLLNF